ncbi:hypothetical protein HDU81_010788 [Chytriomyces hyalinus]|nr:hypothetical protein HDU81_010788 [Chytriomyces hyalinus]
MRGHAERVVQPSGGTQERSKGYRPGCKVSAAPPLVRSILPEFTFAAVEYPDDEWGAAEDGSEKLEDHVVQPAKTATTPKYSILKRQDQLSDANMHPPISHFRNPPKPTETAATNAPTEQPPKANRKGSKASAANPHIRSIKSQFSVAAVEFFPTGEWGAEEVSPQQTDATTPARETQLDFHEKTFTNLLVEDRGKCRVRVQNRAKKELEELAKVAKPLTQSIAAQTDPQFLCANCANPKDAVAIETENLDVLQLSTDLAEEEWGLGPAHYELEDIASMDTQREDCALLEKIIPAVPVASEASTHDDINSTENDTMNQNEAEARKDFEDSDDEHQDWTPRAFSQRKPPHQSAPATLKPWLIDPESEDESKTLEDIQVDIKSDAQARRQETRKKKLMQTQRTPPGTRLEPKLFKYDEQSIRRYTPDDDKYVQPCFTVPSVQLPSDEWNEQESQSVDYDQFTYPYIHADSERVVNFKNEANGKKSNSGKRANAQPRGKRCAKSSVISFEELSARALELSRLASERKAGKAKLTEEGMWRG